ncbi:MAG: hypothetical protein Q7S00_01010, partial [bacterium]|nr:hypothetical protein [bacterium]
VLYLLDLKVLEASDHFKQAIETRNDYPEPYFHLAFIAEAQGTADEAKKLYEKFLSLNRSEENDFLKEVRRRLQ